MIDFMCGPPFFKRLGKSHKRKHNECSLKDITVGHGDARPAMSSSALRMSVKGSFSTEVSEAYLSTGVCFTPIVLQNSFLHCERAIIESGLSVF